MSTGRKRAVSPSPLVMPNTGIFALLDRISDRKTRRTALLSAEFAICFFPMWVLWGVGLLFSIGFLISGNFWVLLLLILAGVGLIGITSIFMDLVTAENGLPRALQFVCTLFGIGTAIYFIWQGFDTRAPLRALPFLAPILCAIHFVYLWWQQPLKPTY